MHVELIAAGAAIAFLGTTISVLGFLVQDDGAGDRLPLFDARKVVGAALDERARNVALTQAGAVETYPSVESRRKRVLTGLERIQELRESPEEGAPKLTSAAGALFVMQGCELVGDKYAFVLGPLQRASAAPPPPLLGRTATKAQILFELAEHDPALLGSVLKGLPGWFKSYAANPGHLYDQLLRRPELITHLLRKDHAALEGPRAFVLGTAVEQDRDLWDLLGGLLYHDLGRDRYRNYVLNINEALRTSTGANFFRGDKHVQRVFAAAVPIPPPECFYHSENAIDGSKTKGSVGVCLDPRVAWDMKMHCPSFRAAFADSHTILLSQNFAETSGRIIYEGRFLISEVPLYAGAQGYLVYKKYPPP